MKVLRTPDDRFDNLVNYAYTANYSEISDSALGNLRLHYLDVGEQGSPIILCMHGEPTWSYLYRKMIPIFVDAGFRVIAPDLIGFGKSDKPTDRSAYTHNGHVNWMKDWLEALDLEHITLVAQDWGGLIGLRLAADLPDRFERISISNTGLPTGDKPATDAFMQWREYSQSIEDFDAGLIVSQFSAKKLTDAEKEAYRAPFPSEEYKTGARQFPLLVPITPDDPANQSNRHAWEVLSKWEKPMLLCYSDQDPVTGPWREQFIEKVPGTRGQPHITLHGGHFIQEDDGVRWANTVVEWMGN
jgi:haloalkane dehalogenase